MSDFNIEIKSNSISKNKKYAILNSYQEGLSQRKIAETLMISEITVNLVLREYGIEIRGTKNYI